MIKSKELIRRTGLLFAAIMLLTSGCGSQGASQESEQDIEIFYNADDGESTWGTFSETGSWEDNTSDGKSAAEDDERIVITIAFVSNAVAENQSNMLTDMVVKFNKENEKYFVEMRTCPWGEELGTMRDRLLVEVGAGGGPDILTSDVFPETQEIMDSGALLDLTPYLEASGITPEKYFPAYAAAVSEDRIYGVCPDFLVIGYAIDPEVLGDREPPENLETLVDMLLEYQGHGSFLIKTLRGRYILAYFLEGSEDLWGMIDWEKKTCDFTGPLFSKMLEVSKRCREDGIKGYEPVVESYSLYMTYPPSRSISEFCPGFVPIGFYFDDGSHYKYQVNGTTLMINANTEHLEGAYAFVSYAMSKNGQDASNEPVNKEMWDAHYQYFLDLLEKIPDHPEIPHLDGETKQETLEAYEDARFAPRRAEAILEIVYEEAVGYIEGDRSKEDVINVIQNRAQLYLDEH